MKTILSLLTIIVLSFVALQTTPHIKTKSSAISSRIESVEPQKTVDVPPQKETPVVAPIQQPEPVPEKPVSDTPAPTPVVAGDCSLAYNYDWPQKTAYAVCMAESSGNPRAANLSDNHMSWAGCMGSFGLMQINCSHGQLYDGNANMAVAYKMYKGWGNSFAAWTSCKRIPGCR